jgi:hypothetical protein
MVSLCSKWRSVLREEAPPAPATMPAMSSQRDRADRITTAVALVMMAMARQRHGRRATQQRRNRQSPLGRPQQISPLRDVATDDVPPGFDSACPSSTCQMWAIKLRGSWGSDFPPARYNVLPFAPQARPLTSASGSILTSAAAKLSLAPIRECCPNERSGH